MKAQRILWFLASLIMLALTACGPSEAEVAKMKQKSFEHGRRVGLVEGERTGITKGKEIGRKQGLDEGKKAAEKAYFDRGVIEGRRLEYPIAFSAGKEEGLNERLWLDVEGYFKMYWSVLIFTAIFMVSFIVMLYVFQRYYLVRLVNFIKSLHFRLNYRFSHAFSAEKKARLEHEKWNRTAFHVSNQKETAKNEITVYRDRKEAITAHLEEGLPNNLKEVAKGDIKTCDRQIDKLKQIIVESERYLDHIEKLKNGIDMMKFRSSFTSSVDYDAVTNGFETLQDDIANFLRFDIKDLGENEDFNYGHSFSAN